MHSKNPLQLLLMLVVLLGLLGCTTTKREIEKIEFTTAYKFSTAIEDKVATDTVPWKYQVSASDYSLKGDYKNAMRHWDLAFSAKAPQPYAPSQKDSIQNLYRMAPAVAYIAEASKATQIVIINEAHHNSAHRVFTTSLLQELYNTGYRNLGLEALGNGKDLDPSLMDRGHPVQKTGFYTKDPQFGNMIRTAIAIGYSVFAYEQTSNVNGKEREIEQAKNITKHIDQKPNEKFLIHCGFAHVLEGEYPRWEKTMAGRIKEYTGLDPLTIDQTIYSERSTPELNKPFLNALEVKETAVLLDKDNKPYRYERGATWADIAVFHPNTTYIDNRPNWLFSNGNKNVSVNLEDIDIEFPVMVLAFKESEDINTAIPVDIAEVARAADSCNLALEEGTYQMVVTNGTTSFAFKQHVN